MKARPSAAQLAVALAAAPLLLVGCRSQPLPPEPVAQAQAPAPPLVQPDAPPAALPPVSLAWSFSPTGESCQARAAAASAAFSLLVRRGEPVSMTLAGARGRALRPGTVPVAFRGAAGTWQARGRAGRQGVEVAMPAGDRTLGQVLALLGGGVVEVGGNRSGLPPLQVPPAGEPGRTWFECAKEKMLG